MRRLAWILGLWALPVAAASNSFYLIEAKLFVDGQLISSPRISLLAGEPSEISTRSEDQTLMMRVVAEERAEDVSSHVFLKFDIEYTADGRRVRSSPQLLAKAGSQATISVGGADGREAFRMDVTATKQ
ncbi:MAG: hypothetical protein AB7G93_01540 [Bdellovibrionales bacterium]